MKEKQKLYIEKYEYIRAYNNNPGCIAHNYNQNWTNKNNKHMFSQEWFIFSLAKGSKPVKRK